MKLLAPLLILIALTACDQTSVSQDLGKNQSGTPPNLFVKETNMTLEVKKECGVEPAVTASK
jgi:hypothetical protein